MLKNEGVWIVIPAFNEAQALPKVLSEISKIYQVVVVDDASSDETEQVCRSFSIHYLRHIVNLGQGAALQTGISYALKKGADFIVSFDADGQMGEESIPSLLAPLLEGKVDVVLGTRFSSDGPREIPLVRRIILKAGRAFTNISTGLSLSDTHNGFRAFSRKAAQQIKIEQNRMAHASEIIQKIAEQNLRYCEIPVKIRYTQYSLAKGQSSLNFLNILWDLFFRVR